MATQPTKHRGIADARQQSEHGVYVARVCPMHLGHQELIGGLIEAFGQNHAILIGSCNHELSIRHLFHYDDRARFVREIFPHARVLPLPDFDNDDAAWFRALDDLLAFGGINPTKAAYIGGSREDVEFYYTHGRSTYIVNRFSGETPKISASEVRDALIAGRPLEGLIDPRIQQAVKDTFAERWATLRSR